MKYSEYKTQKELDNTRVEWVDDTKESLADLISKVKKYLNDSDEGFDTYMSIRDLISGYKVEYTKEDFEKFEHNFECVMNCLMGCDFDYEMSMLDEATTMMKSINWTWGTKNKPVTKEDIIKTIKDHFEKCMESGYAQYSVNSGGVIVETDIYNHHVEIRIADHSWEEWDENE